MHGALPTAARLALLAREAGFSAAAIVDPMRLAPFAERLELLAGAGLLRHPQLEGMELWWVTEPRRWCDTSSILVAALSCHRDEPDDPSTPGAAYGLIAPFARRNYYRLAAAMLRGLARRLAEASGRPVSSFRVCCNSRVPEKPMAAASGLAGYGANSLAVARELGSCFVIGLAVLPFVVEPDVSQIEAPTDPCGNCRRCMDACPVGAITERGIVDPEHCLQGWATRLASMPEKLRVAWGSRLYGCEVCQEVCPRNRGLASGVVVSPARLASAQHGQGAASGIGEIGAGMPLSAVLSAGPDGLKRLVRGSALDQRWIPAEALVRNALLAAGNRGDPAVKPYVERYLAGSSPLLRDAAAWALDRL